MTWDRRAPFDSSTGDLMHYPLEYRMSKTEWRDVVEFEAMLQYETYARGRSAAYFMFRSLDNHLYPMFMKEFDQAAPYMCRRRITGTWTIVKRGKNFGVKLLKAVETCG